RGRIIDKDGGFTEYSTTVNVNNVDPTVTITSPPSGSIYAVGIPVIFNGSFTDPGTADLHTAQWKFDTIIQNGTVTEASGSGTVTTTYTFTTPGVYDVTLTVTDDDGGVGSANTVNGLPARVVIYDPSAGFVTGGGYIVQTSTMIPGGSTNAGAKANYGFNAKYQKNSTLPQGELEFQLKPANVNFHATSIDWLVVNTNTSPNRAQFQGSGTVNGAGSYGFLATVTDGG